MHEKRSLQLFKRKADLLLALAMALGGCATRML